MGKVIFTLLAAFYKTVPYFMTKSMVLYNKINFRPLLIYYGGSMVAAVYKVAV